MIKIKSENNDCEIMWKRTTAELRPPGLKSNISSIVRNESKNTNCKITYVISTVG